MFNAWLKIIMCRRSRDGNPCIKTNWKTENTLGRWHFGRYKEHKCTQLEESSTE